jgi:hypothetical protein
MVYKLLKFKITEQTKILLFLFLLSSLFGLIHSTTLIPNVLLSWYIVVPLIIFITVEPSSYPYRAKELYTCIVSISTKILYVINVLGFGYYIKTRWADGLGWAYGSHFDTVHGLAVVDMLLFFHYLSLFLVGNRNKNIISNLLFFFISFIFCGYGIGVICFFFTFVSFLFLKKNLKYILYIGIFGIFGIFFLDRLSPGNISYIQSNVNKFFDSNHEDARKVDMYVSYIDLLEQYPQYSILGVGVGGYNGRVACLLSKNANNIFTSVFGHQMPVYYTKNIYPLWNNELLSHNSQDGSRNKPFSSFISVFAEYGMVFGIIFFGFLIKLFLRNFRQSPKNQFSWFILLSTSYMIALLISNTWLESSEFFFYALLIFFARSANYRME